MAVSVVNDDFPLFENFFGLQLFLLFTEEINVFG